MAEDSSRLFLTIAFCETSDLMLVLITDMALILCK